MHNVDSLVPGSRKKHKKISVFALVMINVITVVNLRNITMGVEYGTALIFFYLLAAIIFFIPTALITAELATGWPLAGGVYVWVRNAFGKQIGFFAIWLQWIYNVVWYPSMFMFLAGIGADLLDPSLVNNKIYMLNFTLISFWSITLLNFFGMRLTSIISTVGAIVGTIVPICFIGLLGLLWLGRGLPTQIDFAVHNFLPHHISFNSLGLLTNIFFSLMGIEMSAVHAVDVQDPQHNYPKALICSVVIILTMLVLAVVSVALVVPIAQINVISGVLDALRILLHAYHLSFLLPIFACLMIIGSFSGAGAWLVSSARGLLVASYECHLPKLFLLCNKKKVPIIILLLQGLVVTGLSLVFFIMPTMQSVFWWLSNLTSQLALLYYTVLFAAAIKLRYKHPNVLRHFTIPWGNTGIWVVCLVGGGACFGAMMLGFLPPDYILVSNLPTGQYQILLVGGVVLLCLPPVGWLFYYKNYNKKLGQR